MRALRLDDLAGRADCVETLRYATTRTPYKLIPQREFEHSVTFAATIVSLREGPINALRHCGKYGRPAWHGWCSVAEEPQRCCMTRKQSAQLTAAKSSGAPYTESHRKGIEMEIQLPRSQRGRL